MNGEEYTKMMGVVIRELRKERGLNISALHYRTHLAHQAITHIERSDVYPRLNSILSICEVLEVAPSDLFAMVESRL